MPMQGPQIVYKTKGTLNELTGTSHGLTKTRLTQYNTRSRMAIGSHMVVTCLFICDLGLKKVFRNVAMGTDTALLKED